MEAVFSYFGKVILTSGVLFLYYRLFLRDKTFHHYNRFYLLGTMLLSLLFPLLQVNYFTIEVNHEIYLLMNKLKQTDPKTVHNEFHHFSIFSLGSGLVSVFLTGRFFFGIFKISRLKNRFPKEEFEGINFYHTDLNNAPFSYFRNLFWKNSIQLHSALGKQILKHEMVHIEQKHTYDKILIEIIKSVFWFNPFFYLIKNEIHLIHEYLADKNAVSRSDTKAFAQMLLANHFPGNNMPAASPLLSSNLKKRLKMLKTPQTKFSYARRAFAVPLLFALFFAYVVHAKNKEIKADHIEMRLNTTQKDGEIRKIETDETGFEVSKEVKKSIRTPEQSDNEIREKPEERIHQTAKSTEFLKSDEWKAQLIGIEQVKIEVKGSFEDISMSSEDVNLFEKEVESIQKDAENVTIEAGKAKERADIARTQAEFAKKQAEQAKNQSM